MKIFKDLRYLLDVKTRTAANGGDGLVGYQDTQARGFDRFVVREWDWKSKGENWYYNDEETRTSLLTILSTMQQFVATTGVRLSSDSSNRENWFEASLYMELFSLCNTETVQCCSWSCRVPEMCLRGVSTVRQAYSRSIVAHRLSSGLATMRRIIIDGALVKADKQWERACLGSSLNCGNNSNRVTTPYLTNICA